MDGHVTTQRVPEPAGPKGQRMGVEQVPAAGHGRGDGRQARSEDRSHRTGEGERDRAVGSQSHAGGGLDERLRHGASREPAQPSRLRHLLPGTRHGADRDASRLLPPRRDDADVDRPVGSREAQRPCVTVRTQHNRPYRRVERRRRPACPSGSRASGHGAVHSVCARQAWPVQYGRPASLPSPDGEPSAPRSAAHRPRAASRATVAPAERQPGSCLRPADGRPRSRHVPRNQAAPGAPAPLRPARRVGAATTAEPLRPRQRRRRASVRRPRTSSEQPTFCAACA